MTVIDEKSRVPPLDEAAYARLAEAFDRDGVVAAMIIGSQARGTAGPLSDIDIAVWDSIDAVGPVRDTADREPVSRPRLRLDLLAAARKALGTDEVDVVTLNRASPLMRHRAVSEGRRFLDRDSAERVRLEARALIEYLDTEPLRNELSRSLRKSIREGTFGRPREH